MRRIVIAKILVLAVWALYLGIVLGRPDGSGSKIATAGLTKGSCGMSAGWREASPISRGRISSSGI